MTYLRQWQLKQPEIPFTAEALRDAGMKLAEESANEKVPEWSDACYALILHYVIITSAPFLAEDFRAWVDNKIAQPPSKRAYGGIMMRAANEKVIRKVGYGKTTNPKAHSTPATRWIKYDSQYLHP